MKKPPSIQPIRLSSGALLVVVALLMAGCTGSNGSTAQPTFVETPLIAANFVDPAAGANKWLPLVPGTQWVREGTTLIGNREVPNKVVTTVTDVNRVVDGVTTLLVYDHSVAAGQVVQESIDYLAQDKDGNVWYLGSSTEQYEAGRYIAVDEAWLSGVDGAKGGILMPADPTPATPAWSIARRAQEGGDAAEVVKIEKTCVPFGCFEKVLVVREGKKNALDNEFKYYAFGVGQILNEPHDASRHQDFEELINITMLSAEGLAEASTAALRIDGNAAREWPEMFGTVVATRAP